MKLFIVLLSTVVACFGLMTNRVFDGPQTVGENVELTYSPNSSYLVYFPLHKLPRLAESSVFNTSQPLAIYFHGWDENMQSQDVLVIREAYENYNVITVDYSYYAPDEPDQDTVPQIKIVAETFADLLLDFVGRGYNMNNVELVGFSLGGQVAGKVARTIKKISNGKTTVPKIFALDPLDFQFNNNYKGFESLSRTDADYVQVIHTNAGILGAQNEIGTADFYPNGGVRQPGCEGATLYENICSHKRAWELFQDSITAPKTFPAIKCASYDDFLNQDNGGNCDRNNINYLGFGALTNSSGKYYLQTSPNVFTLSRGIDGITPITIPAVRGLQRRRN